MPYVANGSVVNKRTVWRLSIFTDIFWGVLNIVYAFFQSMISPEYSEQYGKKGGKGRPIGGFGGGGGGGGGSGGGGGGRPRVTGTSRIRGVDHSAPMAGG